MHWKKAAGLLVLIGLLVGLGWLRQSRDRERVEELASYLFEVQVDAITKLHIKNTTQIADMTFERDRIGRWSMTAPVVFPADASVIGQVLDVIGNQAVPVDTSLVDVSQLELDPPRAVLTVTENLGGEPRVQSVELGAVDVGGSAVYVRARGAIWRTTRDFEGALVHAEDLFRDKSLIRFDPRSVLEVQRTGVVVDEGRERSIAFHAERDGYDWRMTKPTSVGVDPAALALLLSHLSGARASGFRDAEDGEAVRPLLDEPDVRFRVTTATSEQELLLRRVDTDRLLAGAGARTQRWVAARAGSKYVYEVDWATLRRLALPNELLFDGRFCRVAPSALSGLRWTQGEQTVELWKTGDEWFVGERRGEQALGTPVRADQGSVDDWIRAVESLEVLRFLGDVPEAALGSPAERVQLALQIKGEPETLGELGPAYRVPVGDASENYLEEIDLAGALTTEGRLFRRAGDEPWGLVDAALLDALTPPAGTLRSPWLLRADELTTGRLVLRADADEQVYSRNAKTGRWHLAGGELPAPTEVVAQVDRFLNVKGLRWILDEPLPELEGVLDVQIVDRAGAKRSYRLGRAALPAGSEGAAAGAEGRIEVRSAGQRAEYSYAAYTQLRALVAPE